MGEEEYAGKTALCLAFRSLRMLEVIESWLDSLSFPSSVQEEAHRRGVFRPSFSSKRLGVDGEDGQCGSDAGEEFKS